MSSPRLTISQAAKARLQFLLAQPDCSPDTRLRIQLVSAGCAGFSYKFAFESEVHTDDKCFIADGIPIVVDPNTARSLNESQLDYETHLMGKRFRISNPSVDTFCSCGSSFAFKDFK